MKAVSNRRKIAKTGPDHFPTPRHATEALLHYEKFDHNIWEPAAGRGAISQVLKAHNYHVFSSDLYDYGYGQAGVDFLNPKIGFMDSVICEPPNNIITNPPYNLASEFIAQAYKHANNKVAMLLRLAFLEGAKRYRELFKINPPTRIWVFSKRVSMFPDGDTRQKGGTTAYAWFVWDKKDKSRKTQVSWIDPDYSKTKNKKFIIAYKGEKRVHNN